MIAGKWHRCQCVRGTQTQRDMMRRFNEGDRPFKLPDWKGKS